ncbi:MAG: phenylacetate--CoA ligase family protein, partial [Cytophagales bacterium]
MSWFYKQIFYLGARRRNPSLFSQFEKLKKSERFSREKLKKDNQALLKEFVIFAYQNSPYYRSVFDERGINPIKNWSLEEFKKIPVIQKRNLIEHNSLIHTSVAKEEKTFFCETSGTSGEILTFQRDEIWDSFNRAAIWRGYSWYGVNPWDYSLYFWGYNSNWFKKIKLRIMDFLVNRYRIFDYDPQSMRSLNSKLWKVKSIEGYSSMIYELAKINEDQGLEFPDLKMVKGTSEKVFPHYQEVAEKVYGRRIINEYGSAE